MQLCRACAALYKQAQCGDRRFYLVHPHCVVIAHIGFAAAELQRGALILGVGLLQHLRVQPLAFILRRRQTFERFRQLGKRSFQCGEPFVISVKADKRIHCRKRKAKSARVQHSFGRHFRRVKHRCKYQQIRRRKYDHTPIPRNIRKKCFHSMMYPIPFLVVMKPLSPASSSFLRRRAMLTFSVFSSM